MNNIAMCAASNCPLSASCRRHKDSGAEPKSFWQNWVIPIRTKYGCTDYLPTPHKETEE